MQDPVFEIQRLYPQVFLACHTQHLRRRSTTWRMSEQDSSLLSHLDARHGMRPGELAAHLGLGAPALSATVARLTRLGYIARSVSSTDRRAAELRLTPQGQAALQATSVLDTGRLAQVLA